MTESKFDGVRPVAMNFLWMLSTFTVTRLRLVDSSTNARIAEDARVSSCERTWVARSMYQATPRALRLRADMGCEHRGNLSKDTR